MASLSARRRDELAGAVFARNFFLLRRRASTEREIAEGWGRRIVSRAGAAWLARFGPPYQGATAGARSIRYMLATDAGRVALEARLAPYRGGVLLDLGYLAFRFGARRGRPRPRGAFLQTSRRTSRRRTTCSPDACGEQRDRP